MSLRVKYHLPVLTYTTQPLQRPALLFNHVPGQKISMKGSRAQGNHASCQFTGQSAGVQRRYIFGIGYTRLTNRGMPTSPLESLDTSLPGSDAGQLTTHDLSRSRRTARGWQAGRKVGRSRGSQPASKSYLTKQTHLQLAKLSWSSNCSGRL